MRYSVLAVAAAAVVTFASAASAQQPTPPRLEVGAWTGQVTPPDGGTVNVIYDIKYAGDTLKISINAGEHGTFETTDVKLEVDKLSFKFAPGVAVACVLDKKESIYAGSCIAEDGTIATMDLSPPKKEKKG
jgi:hypothetical protein